MSQPNTTSVPDFKIRVIDEAHGRAIQEELFKRGVKWITGDKEISVYEDSAYLFVRDNRLTWMTPNEHYFIDQKEEEHTFTNGKFSFDKEEAKPDADGWIEWCCGGCPVEDGVMVDYRLSSGREVYNSLGQGRCWSHFVGSSANIVAYRVHKPKSDSASVPTETVVASSVECKGLTWLDTPAQEQPALKPKKDWQQARLLDVLKEMTRLVEQADYDTVYDLLTDEAAPLVNDLKWK